MRVVLCYDVCVTNAKPLSNCSIVNLSLCMDDNRLLTKVATLYYKGMLNQQEIAGRLGLSRQTIGRYLKRAQDVGIVKIGINSNLEYSAELEFQLEKAFHLSEVIVVTPALDTEESVKDALGEAGAAFLQRRVLPNDIIGVAWSSTVLQCALHLPRSGFQARDSGPVERQREPQLVFHQL